MQNEITKTQALLLDLLRNSIAPNAVAVSAKPETVDWEALVQESRAQTVTAMAADSAYKTFGDKLPLAIHKKWVADSAQVLVLNSMVLQTQQELDALLCKADIPYTILKGTAAASYYPKPELRQLGDVDFLVGSEDLARTGRLLESAGYQKWAHENHDCHIVYTRGFSHLEMHFEMSGIPTVAVGDTIREFLSVMPQNAVIASVEKDTFHMPPPAYHAMVLLLHMQHHVTCDGMGLRHLCDWAVFVQKTAHETFWQETLLPLLRKVGLYKFASVMTGICVRHLGIRYPEGMEEAAADLCDNVLYEILAGGNFGRKDEERKKSSLLVSDHGRSGTQRSMAGNLWHALTMAARDKYPIVKKQPWLYPIFFLIIGVQYYKKVLKGERQSLSAMLPTAQERRSAYQRLELFEASEETERGSL